MGKRLFVLGALTALGFALSAACWAQEPAAQPETPHPPQSQLSANGNAYIFLDLLQKGGPVMYPLYACSILMIAFWLERIIRLRRSKVIPAGIMQIIHEASAPCDSATRQRLLEKIQANASPMGRVLYAGLRKADRPALEMEKAIEDAGAKEVSWLQRNNKIFAAVASISPLLGLLGTVTGLMRSFMTVAASSEALGRMEMMAAGIYEALVTTVVGLTIAIPAMALYFYYQDRVDQLVRDIDAVAEEMLEKLFAGIEPGATR